MKKRNKTKKIVIGILLVLVVLGILYTLFSYHYFDYNQNKEKMIEEKKAEWEVIKARYGGGRDIEFDKKTGLPTTINGKFYLGKGNITNNERAREVADDFFRENKEFFGFEDNIKLEQIKERIGRMPYYIISYKQYYKDIPVSNSQIRLVITKEGEVISANSNFYPNIRIGTIPKISINKLVSIVKTKYKTSSNSVFSNASLVIFPLEVANSYEYHLAWEIDVYSEESYKSERYFIDALTGDIIYEEDLYISSTFRI